MRGLSLKGKDGVKMSASYAGGARYEYLKKLVFLGSPDEEHRSKESDYHSRWQED
jgi:hypothetical protein